MSFPDDNQRLDAICRQIAVGRNLARQLATAVREYELSETEFRLLWMLCELSTSIEQSMLATILGTSPAQVSAIVEKLRTQKMIASITDSNDRRRQLWRLTSSGKQRFESIIAAVGLLSRDWALRSSETSLRSHGEDAA